ncbi:hypothetical protein FNH22_00085 [Fulvivirga sp. M361]|uniref:permease prefix domain 2-containing transporter n=1 Tax=Fulvivirga sp. M361 TaxID=2594266 RepID=UPI0011799769|nr:permease prefix domain 2-containing transporter [Fulvivirga sp. M361]TRX62530.1 hypothetical protein FNH22_00085 [Fulvivirga sp. M361]
MKDHIPNPPQLADRFLRAICTPDWISEIKDDLKEDYYNNVKNHGVVQAKALYWIEVFSFLRPLFWKIRTDIEQPDHLNKTDERSRFGKSDPSD